MDIVNVQPALDEVKKVLGVMSDYFSSLYDFLEDPINLPPSMEETVSPEITLSDTLGVAYSTKDLSSNKASGYVVDATNLLAAMEREAGIRLKDKASYYFDALQETGGEITVYSDMNAEYRAGILGEIN